jgi:alkylation response protein AidB-like acyl-CoA dehydrogenase
VLERVAIFSGFSKEHLAGVEQISLEIRAENGAVLLSPGDATQGFYAGHGYCSELPVGRYFREARGLTFHFGTTEMLKDDIAGMLLENA